MLVKLKQFSMVEVEAEAFGDLDKPDLYYQFYPEAFPGRSGSMVPFGLRLLLAELPQHLNKHHEAVDRLYALLAVIRRLIEDGKGGTDAFWQQREIQVLHRLANCALMQKVSQTCFFPPEFLKFWISHLLFWK